ncbi:hypothetical protein [Streptomyces diastatochromogenes]|uniref:Uncharacterized protein n=1 Tax=Streptomyces diastatochromogenes TaxID=42236 RepID=A0A233SCV4_STRDA|nr:hypothetical protein [Streptomyces diastatochromogenes]MCZ0990343.1 hypothetical protein [Streptomyces diastatochromogenes]OXY93471.1 hypothetical protein BEK98_22450 [Streptomyces diastatochromogenes]
MSPGGEQIRIVRGLGGEVEVTGAVDAFAREILLRAGFLFQPSLRGHWIRLPFDLGQKWENEHATWAADMLTAARYPVHLDADLRPRPPGPVTPSRPPAMTAQAPPSRPPHR